MSAAHTPGPWLARIHPDAAPRGTAFVTGGNPSHLVAHVTWERPLTQEHAANAHLIAAAPELLDALRGLRAQAAGMRGGDHTFGWKTLNDALLAADAAIDKANGST